MPAWNLYLVKSSGIVVVFLKDFMSLAVMLLCFIASGPGLVLKVRSIIIILSELYRARTQTDQKLHVQKEELAGLESKFV